MTATQQRQSVSVQPYMLLNSFALNNPPTSSSKFRSMNEESIQDLVPFPRLIPPFRTQHKVSVETLLSCLLRIANSSDTPRIAASKLDVGESQLPYFLEEHTVDDFQIAGAWIEDDWIIRLSTHVFFFYSQKTTKPMLLHSPQSSPNPNLLRALPLRTCSFNLLLLGLGSLRLPSRQLLSSRVLPTPKVLLEVLFLTNAP